MSVLDADDSVGGLAVASASEAGDDDVDHRGQESKVPDQRVVHIG